MTAEKFLQASKLLTRMLLDSSFWKTSLHEIIQPYLQFLPTNVDHAKNSLVQILAGKIFIGARLKAAGHVASNVCYHCGVREDHDHIFRACPQYEQSRPSLATMPHDFCWRTGIMFSPAFFTIWVSGFVADFVFWFIWPGCAWRCSAYRRLMFYSSLVQGKSCIVCSLYS